MQPCRRRPECLGAALLTRAAIPTWVGYLHRSKQRFHFGSSAALDSMALPAVRAAAPLFQILGSLLGDHEVLQAFQHGVSVVFGRKVALRNKSFSFIGLQS